MPDEESFLPHYDFTGHRVRLSVPEDDYVRTIIAIKGAWKRALVAGDIEATDALSDALRALDRRSVPRDEVEL